MRINNLITLSRLERMDVIKILKKAQREIKRRTKREIAIEKIAVYKKVRDSFVQIAGDNKSRYEVYIVGNEMKIIHTPLKETQ